MGEQGRSTSDAISPATSPGSWGGFLVWTVAGAAAALGFFIVGILVVAPVTIGVVLAIRRPALLRSSFGTVTGIGAALLYVAYVQRRGPGTVCWQTARAAGCDEYLNPWPWLCAGIALVAVGIVAHVRRRTPA